MARALCSKRSPASRRTEETCSLPAKLCFILFPNECLLQQHPIFAQSMVLVSGSASVARRCQINVQDTLSRFVIYFLKMNQKLFNINGVVWNHNASVKRR